MLLLLSILLIELDTIVYSFEEKKKGICYSIPMVFSKDLIRKIETLELYFYYYSLAFLNLSK